MQYIQYYMISVSHSVILWFVYLKLSCTNCRVRLHNVVEHWRGILSLFFKIAHAWDSFSRVWKLRLVHLYCYLSEYSFKSVLTKYFLPLEDIEASYLLQWQKNENGSNEGSSPKRKCFYFAILLQKNHITGPAHRNP